MDPKPGSPPSAAQLRAAYLRGENITELLRRPGTDGNDPLAIATAYDLQAGSYVAALRDPITGPKIRRHAEQVAEVVSACRPQSILEAGVGEATTLGTVLSSLGDRFSGSALGFDISWSRIRVARRHLRSLGMSADWCVAELEAIPLPDRSIDVVFTSHAIEPNRGREAAVLHELYRVADRYLILCEPDYESADPQVRERMDRLGYCRGLGAHIAMHGWEVTLQRPFADPVNPLNPTVVRVIRKSAGGVAHATAVPAGAALPTAVPEIPSVPPAWACPHCHGPLTAAFGARFCPHDGFAFPVFRGIPYLLPSAAVPASLFLEDRDEDDGPNHPHGPTTSSPPSPFER